MKIKYYIHVCIEKSSGSDSEEKIFYFTFLLEFMCLKNELVCNFVRELITNHRIMLNDIKTNTRSVGGFFDENILLVRKNSDSYHHKFFKLYEAKLCNADCALGSPGK